MKTIEAVGHRGARGHEPENTLLAVERGIALGADWIEIDVHLAADRLVVIHDARLERTTNGKGPVAQPDLAYLRGLDAGKGERIPFLEEIFDLIDRRARINIELKDEVAAPAVAHVIETYVRDNDWEWGNLVVCSFLHDQIVRIRQILPHLQIGVLVTGLPNDIGAKAGALGAWSINPDFLHVNRPFVDDAHAKGLRVYPYTVNSADDIDRMVALGVDGIISDYPERVVEARQRASMVFERHGHVAE